MAIYYVWQELRPEKHRVCEVELLGKSNINPTMDIDMVEVRDTATNDLLVKRRDRLYETPEKASESYAEWCKRQTV